MDSNIDFAIQLVQGLAKAHEHGITHGDIKPANVMITNDGVAKILDFGLAKLAGQIGLTRAGTTLGTAAYMSPEQAQDEEVDQRSDIWSLGVVLYEMLTGQLPFKGEYEQAVICSILNEIPHEAYKALGLAYYTKGGLQKSLEANPDAVKLNSNHFPATIKVGWALLETNPVEALPWFKKAFMLAPTSASVASAIGNAYMVLVNDKLSFHCSYNKTWQQ